MVAVFLTAVLLVDDPKAAGDPKWLVDLAKSFDVEDCTKALAEAKKLTVRPGKAKNGYASIEEKKTAVFDAESRLKLAKDLATGKGEIPDLPGQHSRLAVKRLGIGDCGRFPHDKAKGNADSGAGVFKVVQVVDSRSAIIELHNQGLADVLVWFEGDTNGWIDGKFSNLRQPVRVVGTKTYKTAIGATNTVPHLVVWSDAEVTRFFELTRSDRR